MADLERFVAAQDGVYERALAEIVAGDKRSHWMWFIFPQIAGLGRSATAERYAISGREEAVAYLAHPVLGPRLKQCTESVLSHRTQFFPFPDDLKLRSCMTLFAQVADDPAPFRAVIARFYDGDDQRTLDLLDKSNQAG
ncbi:DUF1810 domain-containing protein [Actinoplanes sp. CA-142083]|uniref:DUF1810 domain-containing protein n=1 Tax=Actinoplanes sp. CA-142083 TaxID=3239903 RepID=UPI003D8C0580